MSNKPKIYKYKTHRNLVARLRDDLSVKDFLLLYAYNGTGKTRLSMEFKERGKTANPPRDTLYFNAFTEDLFTWENDLENDSERHLKINSDSKFFTGLEELALEEKIFAFLERYAEIDFRIDYENWKVSFSKQVKNPRYRSGGDRPEFTMQNDIKVSRGEENIFIWCFFLAICEITIDENESYNWVKFIYIDDPISSLDDNNAIAVATDLTKLIKSGKGKVKTIVSSHHSLFFNIICNELKKFEHNRYFIHKNGHEGLVLQKTNDTPFFHHVALLSELKRLSDAEKTNTYHFNALRSIMEKTASFFGFEDFSKCIHGLEEDEVLYERALQLLSHGKYSIYDPVEMNEDNKRLFKSILEAFLDRYKFELPVLVH